MKQRHDALLPQASPGEDCAIDSLPEEVLARILGLLQPCQLHWVERVNTRLRNTVVHNNLWRAHCNRVCHNFEAVVATVDAESLRQVLLDLRGLADADSPCNSSSNNSPTRRFSLVPFPSLSRSSSQPCGSPVLKSDSELRRSSPGAQVAPFWGPGLSPGTSAGLSTDTDLSPSTNTTNGTTCQAAGPSIITRLHQLCSGQRNLRTQGLIKDEDAAASRSSSKLWSFNIDLSKNVIISMFYKRLCWRLGACTANESLIAEALRASSTDRPEEHISHVLSPSARMRGFSACYWCSGPSDDVDSIETLDFKLAHPLCVVHEIALQPFKADFQPGSPVYPPRSVRFLFASTHQDLASAGQPHSTCTSTPEYPVENSDRLQHFRLPTTLCAGGFVRVELIGRVQRQQGDNRYYTCMLYIKVLGTPVYGFVPGGIQQEHTSQLGPHLSPVASRESSQTHLDAPRHDDTDCEVEEAAGGMCEDSQADGKAKALFQQQPSVVLKAVLHDPLLQAGGLHEISEMGRLVLQSNAAALNAAYDGEDDDMMIHGNSDDGDFAEEQLEGEHLNGDDDPNWYMGYWGNNGDDNPVDLAHGVGLQNGAHLAHVPIHEMLGGRLDGADDEMEEYPLMYD